MERGNSPDGKEGVDEECTALSELNAISQDALWNEHGRLTFRFSHNRRNRPSMMPSHR